MKSKMRKGLSKLVRVPTLPTSPSSCLTTGGTAFRDSFFTAAAAAASAAVDLPRAVVGGRLLSSPPLVAPPAAEGADDLRRVDLRRPAVAVASSPSTAAAAFLLGGMLGQMKRVAPPRSMAGDGRLSGPGRRGTLGGEQKNETVRRRWVINRAR